MVSSEKLFEGDVLAKCLGELLASFFLDCYADFSGDLDGLNMTSDESDKDCRARKL